MKSHPDTTEVQVLFRLINQQLDGEDLSFLFFIFRYSLFFYYTLLYNLRSPNDDLLHAHKRIIHECFDRQQFYALNPSPKSY